MKVFLLYNENNEKAAASALELKTALTGRGVEVCGRGGDAKKDADESRYLIMLAAKNEDFSAFEPEWRYFQNELKWKRKTEGDIIILADADIDTRRIPFALKGSGIYNLTDTEFIKNLKISAVNPSVPEPPPSAPVPPAEKPRVESGCKDEHVFESKTAKSSSYIDRLNAEIERQRKEQNEKDKDAGKVKDPSDRKFEGISRPVPKNVPGETGQEDSAAHMKNTDAARDIAERVKAEHFEYETKKGDPFPDYKHTPKYDYKNKKVGWGVAMFFVVFFFFILVMIITNF